MASGPVFRMTPTSLPLTRMRRAKMLTVRRPASGMDGSTPLPWRFEMMP